LKKTAGLVSLTSLLGCKKVILYSIVHKIFKKHQSNAWLCAPYVITDSLVLNALQILFSHLQHNVVSPLLVAAIRVCFNR